MDKLSQKQKGGDNSLNVQAGRDVNIYDQAAQSEERDFGIIDEILKSVIAKLEGGEYESETQHTGHVALNKKIEINFSDEEDRERIRQYFKYAYIRISLIEKRIQEEDSERQKALQSHVFGKYNALKDDGLDNTKILEKLFEQFIPSGKKDDPEYTTLVRAFILFFFDDCTIFKKTDKEK